jgi:hypothetical protein
MIDQTLLDMGLYETNLYIKIVDGQPIDHPVSEINLIQVYESKENIPPEYKPFMRTIHPIRPSHYVKPACSYREIGGVWQDYWEFVDLPEDEAQAKEQELIDHANETVARFKDLANRFVNDLTDEDALTEWQLFLDDFNNWELQDPENPNIPEPPAKNS